MTRYRIEADSMGELRVPENAYYGAQTQRAVDNFQISPLRMPRKFIDAMLRIKRSAAQVNRDAGLLDEARCAAISRAAASLLEAEDLSAQFPVDVFQTGSGTSTNMNVNEVLAHIASEYSGVDVHPNDHVNMSQSSNDVVPTAIHCSAALAIEFELLPALRELEQAISVRARECESIIKTGRTHLMDAMPISLGREIGAWAVQVNKNTERLWYGRKQLCKLSQGGTAVGSGINTPELFAEKFCASLSADTGLRFSVNESFYEGLACQDTAVAVSGELRTVAVSLMKISNDLRWMNSGPLAGLGEIRLKALQPGSSIMPGKVNPVIPEAVAMASAQVMGNDATIAIAGQSGNFQLNVMLPVIAYNLLQSIELMTSCARSLADKVIADFVVEETVLRRALAKNPVLVTALNPILGYQRAAEIAKEAYASGRDIIDVAEEMSDISRERLEQLLEPARLAEGGLPD